MNSSTILLPNVLSDIDYPFKISSGPGSGKTTWLVSHIQNVINRSNRLGKSHKVCCITYTRIGAETLIRRINESSFSERVEISTVHNFFYRNLVKPFVHMLSVSDDGSIFIDSQKIKGHIDHKPSIDRITSWKSNIPPERKTQQLSWSGDLIKFLKNIDYKLTENLEPVIYSKTSPGAKLNQYNLKINENDLLEYKKSYWRKGVIHHEDVLYFSCLLLQKKPILAKLLSKKYPYIFLDEFQDTPPLQSILIKKLAQYTSIVGVIGDPAQSIFEFAGAQRSHFIDFNLPNLVNYSKEENYRSTENIVNFLNGIRSDISQVSKRKTQNQSKIIALIGNDDLARDFVLQFDENTVILLRKNEDVKRLTNTKLKPSKNLVQKIYTEDSNFKRCLFLHSLIKAYDYHLNQKYKDSLDEILKHIKKSNEYSTFEIKKIAIKIIDLVLENKEQKIGDLYNLIVSDIFKPNNISGFSVIRTLKPAHKNNISDLIQYISSDVSSLGPIRTIHQSKGDEFNSVLVVFCNSKTSKANTIFKKYVLNASQYINLDNKDGEESRLYYVALSRAKDNLFISLPSLSDEEIELLKIKGIDIIDLDSTQQS